MDMLEQLLEVIRLRPVGGDVFIGGNMHPGAFRVYGGQVLAQAVSAALGTVEEERLIHSQHAYFLRPGDAATDIEYRVERARDGGSFSSRRVVALQHGKPILVSSMSFQVPSRGDEFQPTMPQVSPPEDLLSDRQRALDSTSLDEAFMVTTGEDLDVRLCQVPEWEARQPMDPPLQAWVKTNGSIGDDRALHQAMLAYFSDMYLLDACLMVQGRPYHDPDLQVASLDHALWFHDDFRADDWLLLTMDAERVGGGRGLASGRFFARDGRLVATAMQEGLMRLR
jgi:acyl-CoA thioesterase-2